MTPKELYAAGKRAEREGFPVKASLFYAEAYRLEPSLFDGKADELLPEPVDVLEQVLRSISYFKSQGKA